ncbi:MAG: hypothetical protein V1722_00165 [Candidatus Micrarchaeota archaeon]
MARAVLLWNEHPTEVVAGVHCRRVAAILRRKYGHDILTIKLPPQYTIFGLLRNEKMTPEEKALELMNLATGGGSVGIVRDTAKKARCPVFNFHASQDTAFRHARRKEPPEFQIGRRMPQDRQMEKELIVTKTSENAFLVEMPAVYAPIPMKLKVKELAEIVQKTRALLKGKSKEHYLAIAKLLNPTYHAEATKLGTIRQEKYLHEDISRKLAEEIHKQITADPIRRLARAAKYKITQLKERKKTK